jgi:hypothetical protein
MDLSRRCHLILQQITDKHVRLPLARRSLTRPEGKTVARKGGSKEAFHSHIPAEYMSKYAAGKGKTARIASRNSRISRYG